MFTLTRGLAYGASFVVVVGGSALFAAILDRFDSLAEDRDRAVTAPLVFGFLGFLLWLAFVLIGEVVAVFVRRTSQHQTVALTVVLTASLFAGLNWLLVVANPAWMIAPLIAGTAVGIGMSLSSSARAKAIGWGLGIGVLAALLIDVGLLLWWLVRYGP